MSRSTISTVQLFAMFPDEESARVYLEGRQSCHPPGRTKHKDHVDDGGAANG